MRKVRWLAGALGVLLAGAAVGRAGIFCSCADRPCCPPFDHPTFGYNPVLWRPWPGTPLATSEPPRQAPSNEPDRRTEGETAPRPRVMPPAEPETWIPPATQLLNLDASQAVVHPALLNLFDPDTPGAAVMRATSQGSR